MVLGLLGCKVGMTRLLAEDGAFVPVTVIEAGPCVVTALRTAEQDGYLAVQVGYGSVRKARVNKPMAGHFAKNSAQPCRVVREFRVESLEGLTPGQELRVDLFAQGQLVDIKGVSKGKGFAGTIKRHGFHRGPMTHGSKTHRRPGSTGATDAQRVFLGKRSPGHMGHETCTARDLKVVGVEPERGLLYVRGAVPGPAGGILEIRPSRSETISRRRRHGKE